MKQGAPRRGSQHWPKVQMSSWAVNLPFVLCKARPAEMAGVTPRKKCTCFLFLFVFQGLPSQKQGRSSQKSWGKQQCASRDSVLATAHTRSKSVLQRTSQSFPCWSEYSKITGKLALQSHAGLRQFFPWMYIDTTYYFIICFPCKMSFVALNLISGVSACYGTMVMSQCIQEKKEL